MSIEGNKAVVRRFWKMEDFKGVPKSEIEATMKKIQDEIFTPDFVVHLDEGDWGLDQFVHYWISRLIAFPDQECTIKDIIAEGDKVVACMTIRGTHQGEFLGIPASGKQIEESVAAIARLTDERLVEGWSYYGSGGHIMQLLGVTGS